MARQQTAKPKRTAPGKKRIKKKAVTTPPKGAISQANQDVGEPLWECKLGIDAWALFDEPTSAKFETAFNSSTRGELDCGDG